MISKSLIQEQLKNMPNEFTIDELVERLIFISKIESGLKDPNGGNTISEKELEIEMEKWFK